MKEFVGGGKGGGEVITPFTRGKRRGVGISYENQGRREREYKRTRGGFERGPREARRESRFVDVLSHRNRYL